MSWIPLDFVEFGEHYEMYSEFPYDIRHKYKLNILNGTIDKYGYVTFRMSKNNIRKRYKHHRLIYYALVEHFDLNDRNLEIDHINHLRDDNRIDNLRLVTKSQNILNKTKTGCVSYNFVKELPDKIIVNEEHKIYYSSLNDKFYRFLDVHFRELYETKNWKSFWINYRFEGKLYRLNTTKWRKENGY